MSSINSACAVGQPEDLSGRQRLAWNVAASWAAQCVFVVGGFVLPRFVDTHIGQARLGIWDFAWSLVSCMGFAQMGAGSSVNTYVAKYRAERDPAALRVLISSVSCIQLCATVIVVLVTLGAVGLAPTLLRSRPQVDLGEARWVIFFLGMAFAVQMICDCYCGVITGCHRWDLHNGLNALAYAVAAVFNIVALVMGGGLRSMATGYLVITVLTELSRMMIAHRVCPGLSIHLRDASWPCVKQVFAFGVKTVTNQSARVLIYQANSLVVLTILGPASLAVYSRAGSLMRNAQTFVNKFAFVLTPSASSLAAEGKTAEIKDLVVKSCRYAAYMAVPGMLFLSIMGGPILCIWMGPRYQAGGLLAVLAMGHLWALTQQPALSILQGLNAHGKPGLMALAMVPTAVVLGIVGCGPLKLGLMGGAIAIAFPLFLGNGLYVAVCVSNRLRISWSEYLTGIYGGPVLCSLPFSACLVGSRFFWSARPVLAVVTAMLSGGAVLGLLYWRFVIPETLRAKLRGKVRALFPAARPGAGSCQ